MPYTNKHNIDISLAVWLVYDPYDFQPEEKAISATGLLRPVRQIVLMNRLREMLSAGTIEEPTIDLMDKVASRLGHAIHDSIDDAWRNGYQQALPKLGMPAHQIARVRINPQPHEFLINPNIVPVWIEQRASRVVDGFLISGKMDLIINGRFKDVKSTSVWTYILSRKDEDYKRQISIYRWLNPDKIVEDEFDIQFVFTDWKKADQRNFKDYPSARLLSYSLPLYSENETEVWIKQKLKTILRHLDVPQELLPRCTDEELWRSEPVWKYYSDATKTSGKSTKNFTDKAAAYRHLSQTGKGTVIEVPGEVKACLYCPAFPICTQKDEYFNDGP